MYTANRLQRWMLTLLLYDHAKPDEVYMIASVIVEEDMRFVVDEAVSCLTHSFKSVEQVTQSDEQRRKVY